MKEDVQRLLAPARLGSRARFTWIDQRDVPARTLILDTLLSAAPRGLQSAGIDQADIDPRRIR